MKGNERGEVNVGEAITIGHAKRSAAIKEACDTFEAAAGVGIRTCVSQSDTPRFGMAAVISQLVLSDVDGDVGIVKDLVGKIFLDHVAPIAEANDELHDAVKRIDLHDMPEDRSSANLDHRLWAKLRLFRDPRTKTAGENNRLHGGPPSCCTQCVACLAIGNISRLFVWAPRRRRGSRDGSSSGTTSPPLAGRRLRH